MEDGCISFFMTHQFCSSVAPAGTSSAVVAREVLLMMLTLMFPSGTLIFYASVAMASICRLCARDVFWN